MKTLILLLVSLFILNIEVNATIIVALKLKDGIVVAADSRETLSEPTRYDDNAEKIIAVDSCAVALFGLASVGGDSLGQFTKELKTKNAERVMWDHKFGEFSGLNTEMQILFQKKYHEWFTNSGIGYPGGYVLGCFNANATIESEKPLLAWGYSADYTPIRNTVDGGMGRSYGIIFKGQTDVVSRLLYGVDESIQLMDTKLLADRGGMSALSENTTYYNQFEVLKQFAYVIPYAKMSIDDGGEFAEFLVKATIVMQKYSIGTKINPRPTPGVGGAIDILTVTKDGLKWIRKK